MDNEFIGHDLKSPVNLNLEILYIKSVLNLKKLSKEKDESMVPSVGRPLCEIKW